MFKKALAVMATAAVILGASATSASADSVTCTSSSFSCAQGGYGSQASTWAETYYGFTAAKKLNWTGFTGHNCTRYAAYRLAANGLPDPGISFGNAYEWDERVVKKYGAGAVNGTPTVGSIAQWESNHVAYVEKVTATEITISEDNWGGGTKTRVISRGSAKWPSHFIHLRDQGSSAQAPAPSPIPAASAGDTLGQNAVLKPGQAMYSTNGKYMFVQQTDGNLVLYNRTTGKALWASNKFGSGIWTVMQSDGNLVQYTSAGRAVWATGTNGRGANRVVVQSDGNVVLYTSANKAVWASNTVGR